MSPFIPRVFVSGAAVPRHHRLGTAPTRGQLHKHTGARQLTAPRRKHGEVKDDKKALLKLIRSKLNGDHTACELEEPLEYTSRCKTRAVLVATSAIDINGIQVTRLASKLLMKSAGLSLDSLSHWALVTVDRGEGTCYLYDLMSDQMLPTTKIMKNYRMHFNLPACPCRFTQRCCGSLDR